MSGTLEKAKEALRGCVIESEDLADHVHERAAREAVRAVLLAIREPDDGVLWTDPALLDNAHLFTRTIDAILAGETET